MWLPEVEFSRREALRRSVDRSATRVRGSVCAVDLHHDVVDREVLASGEVCFERFCADGVETGEDPIDLLREVAHGWVASDGTDVRQAGRDVADRDEGVGVEEDGSQAVVECGDLDGEAEGFTGQGHRRVRIAQSDPNLGEVAQRCALPLAKAQSTAEVEAHPVVGLGVPVVIGCALGIAPEVPHDPDVEQLFGFSDDVASGSNDLQRSSTVGDRLIEVHPVRTPPRRGPCGRSS